MAEVTVNRAALEWIGGGDTGTSSRTIWRHMLGLPQTYDADAPADADDFGRCYRLLRRVPEWQSRMGEMAAVNRTWARIAPHWDELEALYESDLAGRPRRFPRFTDRFRQLYDARETPKSV